jgi:O-antigen/teichoic acid export membrane protein
VLRKLVGYAAYMFGANTFTALLNFAVSALGMVTRPKSAFGDYATYMLVYEIGNGMLIYGGNATIQRYAASSDESRQRFAKLVFLLFFVLLGVSALLAGGVGLALGEAGLHTALGLLGIPWIVTHWYGRYLVRSRLDARREARLMMTASLSNTIFQFVFLTATDWRDALIYGDFLALIAAGVAALVLVPRSLGCSLRTILGTPLSRPELREALAFAGPLWLAGQVFTAKVRMSAIFTSTLIGSRAMGALQAMQTLWQFAGKPIEYLGQAALPGLVAAREDRDTLYKELLRFSLVLLPLVAIAVAGGIPLLLQLIDLAVATLKDAPGEPLSVKYAEVPLLIMLPALAMPLTTLEMVSNQYSVALGRPRTVFYAQLVNVLVMLAALGPLSDAFGLVGVVATGALGDLFNGLVFVVVLRAERAQVMRTALRWSLSALLFTALALAPILLTRDRSWGWAVAFPAAALYVAGMFAARVMVPDDLRRVARAVRERRQARAAV